VPNARPFAANPYSSSFTIDKNNIGPRAGISWAVDSGGRTVVRASTGKMFEPPLIDLYDNAILLNGDPLRFNANVAGSAPGAPPFPTSLGRRRRASCCLARASRRSTPTFVRSRRG